MTPEKLFVMAQARGLNLDLGRPKLTEQSRKLRSDPRRRYENEADERGIPGVHSALGKQSRSRRPAEWQASDFAFACAGMNPIHYAAIDWCLGLDPSSRIALKVRLFEYAVARKNAERWADCFKRGNCPDCGAMRRQSRYIEDLVALALMDGAHPGLYTTEIQRAQWFGVHRVAWSKQLSRPYQAVVQQLAAWHDRAIEHIRDGLRHVQHELDAE